MARFQLWGHRRTQRRERVRGHDGQGYGFQELLGKGSGSAAGYGGSQARALPRALGFVMHRVNMLCYMVVVFRNILSYMRKIKLISAN